MKPIKEAKVRSRAVVPLKKNNNIGKKRQSVTETYFIES
jgi:hypothetical protein